MARQQRSEWAPAPAPLLPDWHSAALTQLPPPLQGSVPPGSCSTSSSGICRLPAALSSWSTTGCQWRLRLTGAWWRRRCWQRVRTCYLCRTLRLEEEPAPLASWNPICALSLGDAALRRFQRLLVAELQRGFFDKHIWLSIWDRPPRSRFTRVQRATCCVLLICLFLGANAVWYGVVGDTAYRWVPVGFGCTPSAQPLFCPSRPNLARSLLSCHIARGLCPV